MGVMNFFNSLMSCKVLDESVPKEKREIPMWTKGNFQYNWIGILIIGVPPVMTLLGLLLGVPFHLHSFYVALFFSAAGGLAVTAGYHRLYSHRTYTAGPFMMKLTAFMGAGAFQGSIKWWGRLHRIHHNYVDTDKDPYDARRGFFFSHFGWFCMRMDYELLGTVDTTDLDNHPVVKFQRDYFGYLAALSGIILPWFTNGLLFNDWAGGFFYAAFFKVFLLHQMTFCINSLCHTSLFNAQQNFSTETTPHDSVVFAFVTGGEGYHNFHHAFAQDYRNGHKWYHLDPTKWYIWICYSMGFCWDLKRTPRHVIDRAFNETREKKLRAEADAIAKKLQATKPTVTEVMTVEDVERLVKQGRRLLMFEDYVLDLDKPLKLEATFSHAENVINWYDFHPGGRAFLDAYIGRDATQAMKGGVYNHTHGARCTIPELYVAHLKRK